MLYNNYKQYQNDGDFGESRSRQPERMANVGKELPTDQVYSTPRSVFPAWRDSTWPAPHTKAAQHERRIADNDFFLSRQFHEDAAMCKLSSTHTTLPKRPVG
jgi:hypothetical protein